MTCQVRDNPLGVIALHREEAFSADESEMVVAFASHVSLAIDHARNEQNRRRLAVYTDRTGSRVISTTTSSSGSSPSVSVCRARCVG